MAADLQSAPFVHSGTCPFNNAIVRQSLPASIKIIKGKRTAGGGVQDKAQFFLLRQAKKGISRFSFYTVRADPTKLDIIYTHQEPVKQSFPLQRPLLIGILSARG